MGDLSVLNRTGHATVTWDEAEPETVEKAKQTFTEFIDQGFAMFVASAEAPAEQVRSFDPKAEHIIAVGPYVGG